MLSISRTDAHAVYGQRVLRDGVHVGYIGRDAEGKWAAVPLQGRVMTGLKLRRDALKALEDALLAADELDAQMAANDATLARDAAHEEALDAAHEEALTEDAEREAALDAEADALARAIFGPAATAPPARTPRDLDWADVVADGERAAEVGALEPAPLARHEACPGRRVTLVPRSGRPSDARYGSLIAWGDRVRLHDARDGYVELDAAEWVVYPRLTAEEAAQAFADVTDGALPAWA